MTDKDTRGANSGDSPPDRGAAGDVSTTGHSDRETGGFSTTSHAAGPTTGDTTGTSDAHGGQDDANGHGGGHGGHGDDAADVPTIVPTTWRQLIFPVLILLLVAILVSGPIANAFQSRPTPLPANQEVHQNASPGGEIVPQPTAIPSRAQPTSASNNKSVTPVAAATSTALLSSILLTPRPVLDVAATKTSVAVVASKGEVARAPVRLDFGGTSFVVKAGDTLLPDWRPPQDQGIATWIEGSVANHILYVPFSDANATLFSAAKKGDKTTLLMNTGQVFEFEVTRSERAYNGPSPNGTQFTVTTAMSQDHAGVTLFLIGDSTQDRAVVQADFTGNIQ